MNDNINFLRHVCDETQLLYHIVMFHLLDIETY